MSSTEVWEAFIKAKKILAERYSEPFDIEYERTTNKGNFIFSYSRESPLVKARELLYDAFTDLTEDMINIDEGYFNYPHTSDIDSDAVKLLKNFADKNHIKFFSEPYFRGKVSYENDYVEKFIQQYVKNNRNFSTLEEFKKEAKKHRKVQCSSPEAIRGLDKKLNETEKVERSDDIEAIIDVEISDELYENQLKIVHEYLSNIDLQFKVSEKKLIFKNKFLSDELREILDKKSIYSTKDKLIYEISPQCFRAFKENRTDRHIYYKSEKENISKGLILPDPVDNKFIFTYSNCSNKEDLNFKAYRFLKSLSRIFGKENIKVFHHHVILPAQWKVEKLIRRSMPDGYEFDISEGTIIFNFQTYNQLQKKIKFLKSKKTLKIGDQTYKVKLKSITPLKSITKKLNDIPSAEANLDSEEQYIHIECFLDNLESAPHLVTRVSNAITENDDPHLKQHMNIQSSGQVKYEFAFDEDSFRQEVKDQMENLNGEFIRDWDSNEIVGEASKVTSSTLKIAPHQDINHWNPEKLNKAYGQLKGEKDKLTRLETTVDRLFQHTSKMINPKLKDALVNFKVENTCKNDITDSENYKDQKTKIKNSLLTKELNDKQIEAVTKCLLNDDIFLIQGPPGTGKSTAIAEIVWQHINQSLRNNKTENYKILVTSETNLAVDNALSKLLSDEHMLIKPIRFGSEDKLDQEGRQFSLENLKKWKKNSEEFENSEPNILDKWIKQIKKRASSQNKEKNEYLNKWTHYLEEKNSELRENIFDHYISNCNVVGATCSSIGKLNSVDKFTRFFWDYCNVYHTYIYRNENFPALKNKHIEFNLVIQDEASKATPPELALPYIYTHKAVVIGDHRQLPPMIHIDDFIDELVFLNKISDVDEEKKEINRLIQFVKSNKSEFQTSHFEKLYTNFSDNLKSRFDLQYRMHPAINETIKQFYIGDGGLNCGLVEPVDKGVDDPDLTNKASRYHGITKTPETHIMWFDVKSPEVRKGTSRVNYGEVKAVQWIIKKLTNTDGFKKYYEHWGDGNVEEKEIGVITFYGAQASELNNINCDFPLRVSPVDRFQGMERSIVIVSLVRSDRIAKKSHGKPSSENYSEDYPKQNSLGFAKTPNRLNVALSRARRLLIIVGNSEHFRKKSIYDEVYKTVKNHPGGKIFDFERIIEMY